MFAATETEIVALAFPLEPDETVNQLALDVAVQLHPVSVVSWKESLPPSTPTVSALRLMVYRQAAAAWLSGRS